MSIFVCHDCEFFLNSASINIVNTSFATRIDRLSLFHWPLFLLFRDNSRMCIRGWSLSPFDSGRFTFLYFLYLFLCIFGNHRKYFCVSQPIIAVARPQICRVLAKHCTPLRCCIYCIMIILWYRGSCLTLISN